MSSTGPSEGSACGCSRSSASAVFVAMHVTPKRKLSISWHARLGRPSRLPCAAPKTHINPKAINGLTVNRQLSHDPSTKLCRQIFYLLASSLASTVTLPPNKPGQGQDRRL